MLERFSPGRPITRHILDDRNTSPANHPNNVYLSLGNIIPFGTLFWEKAAWLQGTNEQGNSVPWVLVLPGVQWDVGISYVVPGEAKSVWLRKALVGACLSPCCAKTPAVPQNQQPRPPKAIAESLSSPCPGLLNPLPLSFFLIHSFIGHVLSSFCLLLAVFSEIP